MSSAWLIHCSDN